MELIDILIFIILFYLIIKVNQLSTEKFDATTNAVKTVYNVDVEAIRNLSNFANNLATTNNYTVPANLIVTSGITATNSTISGALTAYSTTISGALTANTATISGALTTNTINNTGTTTITGILGTTTINSTNITISGALTTNTINNTGTTTITGILGTTTINSTNITISGDISISGKIILPNKWTITTDISNLIFNYDNNKKFAVDSNGIVSIGIWLIKGDNNGDELHFNRPADDPNWGNYQAIKSDYTWWH